MIFGWFLQKVTDSVHVSDNSPLFSMISMHVLDYGSHDWRLNFVIGGVHHCATFACFQRIPLLKQIQFSKIFGCCLLYCVPKDGIF